MVGDFRIGLKFRRVCLKFWFLTFRGAKGRTGEGRLHKYQLKPELQFRILPCLLTKSGLRLQTPVFRLVFN